MMLGFYNALKRQISSLQSHVSISLHNDLTAAGSSKFDALLLPLNDFVDPTGDYTRRLTRVPVQHSVDAAFLPEKLAGTSTDENVLDQAQNRTLEVDSLMNFLHLSTNGYFMRLW